MTAPRHARLRKASAGRPARTKRPPAPAPHPPGTRERLLDSAMDQFAEHGYAGANVRDICRDARANVAAVNYHFEGKLGLYREVVRRAIQAMREQTVAILTPDARLPAEEQLRRYVHAFLPLIASRSKLAPGRAGWIHRLMRHEMAEPTPLAPWIAEQVLMLRVRYLMQIVARLLRADEHDPRIIQCVISVEAQCLFYAPNKFRESAFEGWPPAEAELAEAAEHIVRFSLAGIRATR